MKTQSRSDVGHQGSSFGFFGLLIVAAGAMVPLWGCGGGSSNSTPAGATCALNSECAKGLTCSFGRCQSACKEERDCPTGQQCVKNATGTTSCLLPAVEACHYNSDCPNPLVCGTDLKCRNQCHADRDCATATQRCVLPEGVCAEPDAIGADGLLLGSHPQIAVDSGIASVDAGQSDSGRSDVVATSVDVGSDVATNPDTAMGNPDLAIGTPDTSDSAGLPIDVVDASSQSNPDIPMIVDTATDPGLPPPGIDAGKPTITSFVAAAPKVTIGQGTTLTATFTNGTGSISPVGQYGAYIISGMPFSTGNLSVATTFTLTVKGDSGETAVAQVTVDVTPYPMPAISSFIAAASTLSAGHATTLTAVFTNGTGEISPTVGAVTSGAAASTGVLNATTVFTLKVTGTGGDVATQKLTVTVVPAPTTVASGQFFVSALAVDGTSVYWTTGNSVMKVATSGGAPVPIASGQIDANSIAVDDTSVYWTDYNAGTVMKVDKAGSGAPVPLATGQYYANGIAVDSSNVYWTTYSYGNADGGVYSPIAGTGSVMKVALSGSGAPVTLATAQDKPNAIAVYGNEVYWNGQSTDVGGSLSKAAASGGAITSLAVGLGLVGRFVVDATGIYWYGMGTSGLSSGIEKLALTGGAATTAISAMGEPGTPQIVIDSGNVYWVEMNWGSVMKAALVGGGAPVTLAQGSSTGGMQSFLAVDATSVYWSSQTNGAGGSTSSILKTPK
jgi:hypothetical protein